MQMSSSIFCILVIELVTVSEQFHLLPLSDPLSQYYGLFQSFLRWTTWTIFIINAHTATFELSCPIIQGL